MLPSYALVHCFLHRYTVHKTVSSLLPVSVVLLMCRHVFCKCFHLHFLSCTFPLSPLYQYWISESSLNLVGFILIYWSWGRCRYAMFLLLLTCRGNEFPSTCTVTLFKYRQTYVLRKSVQYCVNLTKPVKITSGSHF